MKREIKFRAWWRGVNDQTQHMLFATSTEWLEFKTDEPLMQYTGLKDKNGKEIYEGDICLEVMGNTNRYHEIENMMLWYRNVSNKEIARMEVIGNIHQNPELL